MLVIMCIYLLSKDAIRLINFFFLNKPAQPADLSGHLFKKHWKNITLTIIKITLITYTLVLNIYQDVQATDQYGDEVPKPPLYGIYDVTSFVRNKDTIAPLKTDTTRWDKLVISRADMARVILMNDSSKRYGFVIDTVKDTIVMDNKINYDKIRFTYSRPTKNMLLLKGKFKSDSLTISLKRYDLKNFLLINRGFHWINEYPLNR
jgi:hypothetical protein